MTDYHVEHDIAVIEVNNPPVNALGTPAKNGIINDLERANNDPQVKAIVLCGKGHTFPAGADIREFAKIRSQGGRNPESRGNVYQIVAKSKKPVVAAIHGNCLGGGFEISLATHYRIAHEKTRFGFPEVTLGILPAGTGTQRFPHVVGLKAALDLIPTGRRISSKEAFELGAVDKVVTGCVREAGIEYARLIADKPLAGRITHLRPIKDADQVDELVAAALENVKRSKGFLAPVFNIKSVRAAVDLPFEEGLKKEAEYARLLFSSGQSSALQYAFFTERAAPKWVVPGVGSHKTAKARPLKTGAVIGGGSMGTGIAMAMMNAGISVVLIEQNQQFLDKAAESIRQLYSGSVKLGRMSQDQAKKILTLLKPSVQYSDLADVDIVVEAVFENMKLKKEVFARLDQVCKPSATLASNTSTLNIDEIASATRRPESVIGTHFFIPAYYMRLLENVHGEKTSAETIATAQEFGRKLGKIPVVVGNCHAFVANRMFHQYGGEGRFLVEEGATPEQVDEALEDFGFPLGILKIADLTGLDVGVKIREELEKSLGIKVDYEKLELGGMRYSPLGDMLVERGRYGRKSGKGWYKYERPGAKDPYPDEDVYLLIDEFRAKFGIERRNISAQEIVERCVYAAINEGFHIMEEGYAYKPEDIDVIWLNGYGFPRYFGGPMFYASMVGLKKIYQRVQDFHQQFPNVDHWKPSRLMKHISDQNLPISQWGKAAQSQL